QRRDERTQLRPRQLACRAVAQNVDERRHGAREREDVAGVHGRGLQPCDVGSRRVGQIGEQALSYELGERVTVRFVTAFRECGRGGGLLDRGPVQGGLGERYGELRLPEEPPDFAERAAACARV